jgi:hypothetical protein
MGRGQTGDMKPWINHAGIALAAAAAVALFQTAGAEPGGRGMPEHGVLTLREVEARVLPLMRGTQYLGPEFDSNSKLYRLKFMRDAQVIYVDVDGRSGRILGEIR